MCRYSIKVEINCDVLYVTSDAAGCCQDPPAGPSEGISQWLLLHRQQRSHGLHVRLQSLRRVKRPITTHRCRVLRTAILAHAQAVEQRPAGSLHRHSGSYQLRNSFVTFYLLSDWILLRYIILVQVLILFLIKYHAIETKRFFIVCAVLQDAFIKITRSEGLKTLWSGLPPTL